MRTNIVINDQLMNEALQLTNLHTKKAVVEEGLKLLVRMKKQQKIKSLRGKLRWEGDLDEMRRD
ncbi:MAG: type II toxin-antitoxin system VapB family antitoxin [Candidatus Electrothrix sp. ATG1]|nr:type II toxin-antitoxin system VapB family antitoxin [Candidatus Electrothrix sp. ATG1]